MDVKYSKRGPGRVTRAPKTCANRLFLLDGLDGALGKTCAALGARLLIDDGFVILHRNGLERAGRDAAFAADTFIRDYLDHFCLPY
jgi:hypothetical protein